MIVTLAPQPGPASAGPDEDDPVPLVDPIIVSAIRSWVQQEGRGRPYC